MIDPKERKIKVLEDEIINKIAAGEVVERPASIVKELVENCIDAGATRIMIDLEEGGKKSITITDNGRGISKESLPLSVIRHATSKIGNIGELFSVASMGFRGEALASISAVSQFTLVSRHHSAQEAYKLEQVDGGLSYQTLEWNHPVGTTIKVENLFHNVPVRLKFLKSAQTEFSHCLETVQSLALANPLQTFILNHNGKEKLLVSYDKGCEKGTDSEFFGEQLLRSRVSYLYGEEVSEQLLYVSSSSEYLQMEALIAPPGLDKATSKSMFTFVNKRWVKDKVVRYGILRGYHSHLLKGRYPYAFCYLTLSPELVDVNVHPSKTELRFQYADEVQGQMARTIRDALRKESWAEEPENASESKKAHSFSFQQEEQGSKEKSSVFSYKAPSSERRASFSRPSSYEPREVPSFSSLRSPVSSLAISSLSENTYESKEEIVLGSEENKQTHSWVDWNECLYLGASHQCYLIFEYKRKLLFVDQHAFHERILYEKLCKDQSLLKSTESLLIPEALSLSANEVSSLLENKSVLESLGFAFEGISDEEIEVLSVPSLLKDRDLGTLFAELSGKTKDSPIAKELHHDLLATVACHSAVRAGDTLTGEQIERLKREALEVDFSANCPHGRRVFKWFTELEVKGWFDRT